MDISGPAFPIPGSTREYQYGLSKRELYAVMALQGRLSDTNSRGSHEEFAKDAFKYADAMLAEGEK